MTGLDCLALFIVSLSIYHTLDSYWGYKYGVCEECKED